MSNIESIEIADNEGNIDIFYDDTHPRFIHGPDYPETRFTSVNRIVLENPKYDSNYGKNYQYNYIESEGPEKSQIFIIDENCRPPIPTSRIPQTPQSISIPNVEISPFFPSSKVRKSFFTWKSFAVGAAIIGIFLVLFIWIIVQGIQNEIPVPQSTSKHVQTTPSSEWCADNFTLPNSAASKCWKLMYYEYFEYRFFTAKQSCKQIGGHLATIKSAEENQWMRDFIGDSLKAWIGLTCDDIEPTACKWDDDTRLADGYTNFDKSIPDERTCTLFDNSNGLWSRVNYDTSLPFYVCEVDR